MTVPTSPPLPRELRALIAALEEAAVITSASGELELANARAVRMMGLEPGAAISREELACRVQRLTPDGQPFLPEQLPERLALAGQAPSPVELCWRIQATGEERWMSATAAPIASEDGAVHRVLTVYRDLTALRRSEWTKKFLAQASDTLSSSLDAAATLQSLADLAVPALADWCSVEVVQPDGRCLQGAVAHTDPAKIELTREVRRRNELRVDSPTGLGQTLRTGKPMLVPYVTEEILRRVTPDPEDLRLVLALGLRASVAVPLIARGRILGLLGLYSTQPGRRFGEEDVAVAQELANRAAQAVENARLYQEAQAALARKDEEARLNDTLRRLGNAFAVELDADRLIQSIIDEATSLVGASAGAFLHHGGERGPASLFCHVASGEPAPGFHLLASRLAPSLFDPGLLPQDAQRCEDVTRHPDYALHAAATGDGAPRSLLAIPILSRSGLVLGGLVLGAPRPNAFTVGHGRILQGIALQAAITLDNAHLFQQLRDAKGQIHSSEERLRMAVAAGRMGYFDFHLPTLRMTFSRRFEEMLGIAPGTFDGNALTLERMVHPEDLPACRARFDELLARQDDKGPFVFRALHPDGALRWIEVYTRVSWDGDDQPQRLLGIGMDVTERYEAQEKVRRLVTELKRSNAELEQFAYVASHDLQEPLRMVASYTQLLGRRYRGKLDPDADEFITFAVDGVARMKRLITDLLAFSRVATQARPPARLGFGGVVERAVRDLQASVEEHQAEIILDTPFPEVVGDETQLGQLMQNLLGNALKFHGKAPPRIHVGAERGDAEWIFHVRDNGLGIEEQYFERIFIIFQRLHDRAAYPGTGIGLALCKRIVERHGGRIWLESRPGEGTTFFFTLPLQAQMPTAALSG